MVSIYARASGPAHGEGINIISRREIEPLLAKAVRTSMLYGRATDCQALVLDKNNRLLKTPEDQGAAEICDFCGTHCHATSKIREGDEYPCVKIHREALAESRHGTEPYVYVCAAGLVFWTVPLYRGGSAAVSGPGRNGRYAGALTAGPVLVFPRQTAAEKFSVLCKNKIAEEKFIKLLENIPVKTHAEIEAMSRFLWICAKEIPETEEHDEKMRFTAWREKPKKTAKLAAAAADKKEPFIDGTTGPDYPMEKERMLFAAFRRGDNETGNKILHDLMNHIISTMPGDFEIVRIRAIELAVLLSRAAAVTDTSDGDELLEVNNRYLKRIQESKNPEELIEIMSQIADRVSGKIFSLQGKRHASVLRRAERYIWKNYTRKLSLNDIAASAGLSAPYFSSIFKEEMKENLSNYLNRLRVERAAMLLTETRKPLSEIAAICGFEDQSWFSKIFKKINGTSPGKFRESNGRSSE